MRRSFAYFVDMWGFDIRDSERHKGKKANVFIIVSDRDDGVSIIVRLLRFYYY